MRARNKKKTRHQSWITTLLIVLLQVGCFTGLGRSQSLSGIGGTVTDNAGATVGSAIVTAKNIATGVLSHATTSSAGTYIITGIVPGTYTVTMSAKGFRTSVNDSVTVAVGGQATVNALLVPGAVNSTVEVTSNAITLETDQPQVSATIEHKVVEELPDQVGGVNGGVGPRGRQIDDFLFLAPGVQGGEYSHRISGGEDFSNEVLFQGVPAVQSETEGFQSNINPPFEMVSEFNVATAVFSTQYGLGQGAASYQFVSGTNTLHGDAFEINRNNYFDARGLVQINPTVPVDKQNNYGFSLGGPVYLGKLYDGRNRTFWHVTSEWYDFNQQPSVTMTVPTPLAKQGNFSQYGHIYVPQGVNCAGLTPGQEFPNDTIPASCFSPLASSLLSQVPAPTIAGQLTNNINSQIGVLQTRQTSWGFTVDHNFNDRQAIHYSQWRDVYNTPLVDNNAYFGNELSGLKTEPRLGSGFFLTYSNVLSPHLVATAGVGWTGELNNEINQHQNVSFGGVAGSSVLPTISFLGLAPNEPTTWGVNSAGETESINRKLGVAIANNYIYTRGRQTITFGFETRRAFQDDHECVACGGNFDFSSLTTSNGNVNQNAALNENNTGNAFASFLLGQVDSTFRQQALESKLRNFSISPYIMDQIKLTPHLTVSAGLRWDILQPFTADTPSNIAFLNPNLPNPGAVSPNGTPLLGAATALGNCSLCAGFDRASMSFKHVGPRAGFAYQVNPKTVVLGGYALIFLDGGAYEFGTNKVALDYGSVLAGTNQTNSSGTNVASYGSWDGKQLAVPTQASLTRTIGNGSGILHVFQQNGIAQPYSQMYNLGVQRELPWNLFLSVSYVGNHGVHLPSALNPTNQLNPQYLSLGQTLGAAWTSPAAQAALQSLGYGTAGGYYTPYANFINDFPNQTLAQALVKFPQYLPTEDGNTLNNFDTNGVSIYNAMQVQFQKRFTNGLSFLTAYSLSRVMSNADEGFSTLTPTALNGFNQSAEWAVSSADQTHLLTISGVYELPFGAGKPYLANHGFVSKEIIGGWQLSGVFQYESGTPFGISASGSPLETGGNRANIVPGVPVQLNYKNYYRNLPVFNTAAFSDPGRFAVGDAPRNQSDLRNPFQSNENLALAKKFQFGEKVSGELRMEYFNVLNRMQICGSTSNNMDTNVSDSRATTGGNFGYVVAPCQANNPRQGQAYFRVNF